MDAGCSLYPTVVQFRYRQFKLGQHDAKAPAQSDLSRSPPTARFPLSSSREARVIGKCCYCRLTLKLAGNRAEFQGSLADGHNNGRSCAAEFARPAAVPCALCGSAGSRTLGSRVPWLRWDHVVVSPASAPLQLGKADSLSSGHWDGTAFQQRRALH